MLTCFLLSMTCWIVCDSELHVTRISTHSVPFLNVLLTTSSAVSGLRRREAGSGDVRATRGYRGPLCDPDSPCFQGRSGSGEEIARHAMLDASMGDASMGDARKEDLLLVRVLRDVLEDGTAMYHALLDDEDDARLATLV